jgi:hypothetical protein
MRAVRWLYFKKNTKVNMIYFLKANNRIKIGYANDPTQRIPSIQTSSPFELEVLLIINGNYDRERELHQKFEAFRKV